MNKILIIFFLTICFLQQSCNKKKEIIIFENIIAIGKPKKEEIGTDWHLKDIMLDTLAGISLDKAYNNVIKNRKGEKVIVAVIDTETDTNHEDLRNSFWINSEEIPNNNIDDDNNGYIDDIHGWNFLGNSNGDNVIFSNYEIIRIIRKYESMFAGRSETEIDQSLINEFRIYKDVINQKEELKLTATKTKDRANAILERLKSSTAFFDSIFNSDNVTIEKIKSYQPVDSVTEKFKKDQLLFMNGGLTKDILVNLIDQQNGLIEKSLDINYDERKIIGDNPYNLEDKTYGNPLVSQNLKEFYHGTVVSGILTGNRNDTLGIKGISDNIIIMPLAISANGDEHDKDIALAIRYAVDNGAHIINMSSGKQYSINQNWVQEALKYASENDVLFITSAGNDNLDLDSDKNHYYPNDNIDNNTEICNSFIMVGANTSFPDENFKYRSSNYGKKNVDIFAPGIGIMTTIPNNKYRLANATSIATPIVTGVAALIKSYYPDFTAAEIKNILLESGTSYQVNVKLNDEDGKTKIVPFSELSKSGKVVNAYNALLMAEELSKN